MERENDVTYAKEILERHGLYNHGDRTTHAEELLIPLLQDLQQGYGYLPREILVWVNEQTGIPLSRMYGVITFYAQFYLEKRGEHIVKCCEGTACHVKGAPSIVDTIERELGIRSGETTAGGEFTFETVNCLGACALAPLVVVGEEYYGKMTQDRTTKLLHQMKEA